MSITKFQKNFFHDDTAMRGGRGRFDFAQGSSAPHCVYFFVALPSMAGNQLVPSWDSSNLMV